MKKILLNIGFPIMLALVLQGCSQTNLTQNEFEASKLIVNNNIQSELSQAEPNLASSFVRVNKITSKNSANAKAQAWRDNWKDRVAKAKSVRLARIAKARAAHKAKFKTTKSVTTKTNVKKTVIVSKPQKLKGKGRARYTALITKYARAYGVPVRLAHAVVQVESNFRANARGGVGEIGLMQLRLATARGIGYRGSAKALYNPETNIKFGMKYLGKAYQLGGGTTCGAILKYNAGHGAKRMNRISANYCRKVKRII